MFEIGDYVHVKFGWCDHEGQHKKVYTVLNVNDKTERCVIQLVGCTLPLIPTEIVSFEMIEKI